MNLKILSNEGVINNPAKHGDVGFDLVALDYPEIVGSMYQGPYYSAISHLVYDTQIKIEPELIGEDYEFHMMLYPRSSIIKTNLILANSVGVIDAGYRGSIKVCFKYISQPEDCKVLEGPDIHGKKARGIVTSINPQRIYHEGDKIAQLIPNKILKINTEKVDSINETSRADGGFGSTGR